HRDPESSRSFRSGWGSQPWCEGCAPRACKGAARTTGVSSDSSPRETTMSTIRALAAMKAGGPLEPFSYDPGPLGPDEVEIAVEHCGICHSDLSMLDDEWGFSAYPFVPGHEAIGRVVALGANARGV